MNLLLLSDRIGQFFKCKFNGTVENKIFFLYNEGGKSPMPSHVTKEGVGGYRNQKCVKRGGSKSGI